MPAHMPSTVSQLLASSVRRAEVVGVVHGVSQRLLAFFRLGIEEAQIVHTLSR